MNFNTVFDAHPEAERLYVVGSTPYIREQDAQNQARTSGRQVRVVRRDQDEALVLPPLPDPPASDPDTGGNAEDFGTGDPRDLDPDHNEEE
jgi:hypothetical protein